MFGRRFHDEVCPRKPVRLTSTSPKQTQRCHALVQRGRGSTLDVQWPVVAVYGQHDCMASQSLVSRASGISSYSYSDGIKFLGHDSDCRAFLCRPQGLLLRRSSPRGFCLSGRKVHQNCRQGSRKVPISLRWHVAQAPWLCGITRMVTISMHCAAHAQ